MALVGELAVSGGAAVVEYAMAIWRRGNAVTAATVVQDGVISFDITRRWPAVSDVLIRDVPDDVLAGLDAHATRLGLSRVEYIRRRLAQDATSAMAVTTTDLRSFADAFTDLADPSVIDDAWK